MRVLNIHKRTLNQPKSKVTELLKTLSTENDRIWPNEKWPEMKFKNGIQVGAKGGHGPIRYSVEKYNPDEIIQFRFSKPNGFNGIHKFEIIELDKEKTEIKHTIEMYTTGKGTLIWTFAISSLHNALIEDGFDKLENNFSENRKSTEWSLWVKFLRKRIAKKA
ncbi:MAG: hypothetical protein COA38_15405 [Fluviicola sp.]|nr:MAG: hypothetical protein COA38_15405 [Fluviicola sp.]